jgi:lipopolysaccharide export system permease protein
LEWINLERNPILFDGSRRSTAFCYNPVDRRPFMKIIDRYLWRELSVFFIGIILGFVVLMVGNTLYIMSELIFNKRIPIGIVSQILLLRVPAMFVLGFPVATLFAVLLTLGRLGRDSEIIAIRTGGVSMTRIVVPVLLFSVVVSILTFWLNEKVVPQANHISQNYIRQFWVADVMESARANVFFHVSDDIVIYTEAYNEQTKQMGRLTFFELDQMGFPDLSVVRRGYFERDFLILEDGETYDFGRQGELDQSALFNEVVKDVSREMQELYGENRTPQEMTGTQLRDIIDNFKENNVRPHALETDYYFKFSIPVANFVFAMVGILFAVVNPRRENASGVIFAIICIGIYWVLMTVMRSLGQKGLLEPWIAAWGQNIVFFILGLPLLFVARR